MMPAPLPRCFFDIAINGVATGRVVFELYSNVVPKTTENFRCLCTGERGEGKSTFKPLHYKGTPIHRIVKGFIVQGGDFSCGDGTGGESIYGGMFKDEAFQHKHEKPFLLSMANKGPNTNGSQFFITTRPAPHLDGIHVVFGHVISGVQFVTEMENQKVDTNHRPYADVRIVNSGELVRVSKAKKVKKRAVVELSAESISHDESSSEIESEESSSDERSKRRKKGKVINKEKRKKRRREKKLKTKKKKKPPQSDSDSEESSVLSGDDHVTSTMVDEEEPPLPPELEDEANKSWLYRRSRTPSPVREERKKDTNLTTTRSSIQYFPII
ncbi:peptidyl-prolyl cis-trans isomerase G-like [Halichondria panicea]|uniref:peptidyl-prolyl cis-trans isomerase G-like n=1 Tax=Halichondria panicea TaxID=6063 RepID=UPI00312BA208